MKQNFFLLIIACCCVSVFANAQPLKLSSWPSAPAVIYLDFDGEEVSTPVWNNGNTISCAPSGLTATQITEVFNRVSEDYRPFDINITTDLAVFEAAPIDKKMRVIITPTSYWFGNAGGVSYLGSFIWGDETPCFVFCDKLGPNNPKLVAECCSHESGHTLGLSHQSKYDEECNLTATYNEGTGTGETAWAPIMGNSYYRNMSGWSNGPTPYGCGNTQDNLSIITSQNGFGYRADDHNDDIKSSPTTISSANFNAVGVISNSNDKDAFEFTLDRQSNVHLDILPFSIDSGNNGADLDIKLSLYDAAGNMVRVYNPAGSMSVSVDTGLAAGKYFMLVEGTGNGNTTGYGSLGSYAISGWHVVVPVCNITLTGSVNAAVHHLGWSIDCNENISSVVLQSSADGIQFNYVSNVTYQSVFDYTPAKQTDLFYRLQVTSISGRVVYSSTLLLKKPVAVTPLVVSAVTSGDIRVTANGNYQYQLTNIGGNRISTGNIVNGVNDISLAGKPAGVYILLLAGCGEIKSVRVLKL